MVFEIVNDYNEKKKKDMRKQNNSKMLRRTTNHNVRSVRNEDSKHLEGGEQSEEINERQPIHRRHQVIGTRNLRSMQNMKMSEKFHMIKYDFSDLLYQSF